jgi:hypothetical protein
MRNIFLRKKQNETASNFKSEGVIAIEHVWGWGGQKGEGIYKEFKKKKKKEKKKKKDIVGKPR